jgi:hypothetical protein
MIANGLTKALPKQRFQSFVDMIGMVDIKEQLNEEKQLEDLRENIKARWKDSDEIIAQLTHGRT